MANETANLPIDKEGVRQLVLQSASFLKLFGGAYPRLSAVSALLTVEAEPAVWDVVWGAFAASPAAQAMLRDPLHHASAEFLGLGTQSAAAARLLEFVMATGDRPPDYYTLKAQITGVLMIAMSFASLTKTAKDDMAVQDLMTIFLDGYDTWYDQFHGQGGGAAATK